MSDLLRRRTGLTLWRQIGSAIENDIRSGRCPADQPLPTERELAQRFAVARQTIRRAVNRCTVGLNWIECTASGKALKLTAIEQSRIDPGGEILKALERTAPFALGDQRIHGLFTDALERSERVADGAAFDGEVRMAGVDIRRQAFDSAAADVLDEHAELVGQRHIEAHRRGVELRRMMRLQPGGLISDQRVACGMALVEAVAGEFIDRIE